jgi:hypothetical protein
MIWIMTMTIAPRTVMLAGTIGLLTGCGNSRPLYEYEYDTIYTKGIPGNNDFTGNGPITLTIRLEHKGNSLIIRSKGFDALGTKEFGTETLPCSIFDEGNFTCERSDGRERLTMKDGQLTSYMDGEQKNWQRHICILGHRAN